jgi:hypothetical protein
MEILRHLKELQGIGAVLKGQEQLQFGQQE